MNRGVFDLSDALSQLFPSFDDDGKANPGDLTLLRTSRAAMATFFEIMLPVGLPQGAIASEAALDLIDELEDQLSVFRSHSEVSRLNDRAASEDVPVEARLFDLLALSQRLTHETRGAFDIATGALTKAWGFYQRSGKVPSVPERSLAMSRTGLRHVVLDAQKQSVRYLRQGLEINLGSIGKGYALDRVAELLRTTWRIDSGLLHGGMSSVVAMGTPPGQERGWVVSLRHPWDESRSVGVVHLRDRALGTSAATYQHFAYNGRTLGHILDPRKGWPAEGLQQVSAIAPTAAEADALSTAFFVMGLDAARDYCQNHPNVGTVILPQGENAEPVTLNLTPETFTLPSP